MILLCSVVQPQYGNDVMLTIKSSKVKKGNSYQYQAISLSGEVLINAFQLNVLLLVLQLKHDVSTISAAHTYT